MFSSRMPEYKGPIPELAPHYAFLQKLKEKLDQSRPLSPSSAENLQKEMILRYTYHSNAIEGNTLTLMETKVILEDGLTIGGKSMREHLEAINHRDAIVFLEELARDSLPPGEWDIRELHRLVLKGIDPANAGGYRQQNVLISGAGFTPPDFLHVQDEMRAFCRWRAEDAEKLHPIERAARVHADFVNIHPFLDGNGRTARLLMNLELIRAGYPLVIIPVEERSLYYENLDAIAVKGDYKPFILQICTLSEKSFEPYWSLLGK